MYYIDCKIFLLLIKSYIKDVKDVKDRIAIRK